LTVLHLVFGAFLAAFLADLGAGSADCLGILARSAHRGCGNLADLGAVDVQRDAPCHHFYVVFLQACSCAVVAGLCTVVASSDATRHALVWHINSLSKFHGCRRSATRPLQPSRSSGGDETASDSAVDQMRERPLIYKSLNSMVAHGRRKFPIRGRIIDYRNDAPGALQRLDAV
jgi:hypothetical protein